MLMINAAVIISFLLTGCTPTECIIAEEVAEDVIRYEQTICTRRETLPIRLVPYKTISYTRPVYTPHFDTSYTTVFTGNKGANSVNKGTRGHDLQGIRYQSVNYRQYSDNRKKHKGLDA